MSGADHANVLKLVVGVGASAGGVEALEDMFAAIGTGSHAAFLVVTHMKAGRNSLLPQILARRSGLPVTELQGHQELEADHIYVAPVDSTLTVLEGEVWRRKVETDDRRPIDVMFHSLADECGVHAVAVVLSGSGTDGSAGAQAIKAAGGRIIVQEAGSARYDQMPTSVTSVCEVDHVVPPDTIGRVLATYAEKPLHRRRYPAREFRPETLQQVFALLRNFTRHDFSRYKQSTIARRIERRMHVHGCDTLEEYVRLLQAVPNEIDQLFTELLINVTAFFRDPEAFDLLATRILPTVLSQRTAEQGFRAWVAGCSTGEEAYSVAMVLRESLDNMPRGFPVQIFATDLDKDAIDIARQGVFPASIAGDVSAERLERFFVKSDGGYRIHKDIREMVVFAQQNIIADPPFTNLDFLSCRNLLIYLDVDVQQRLIPLFHYSLRPGGVLFLGSSESLGLATSIFEPLDKKWKIFRRSDLRPNTATELSKTLPFENPATRSLGIQSVRAPMEPNTAQLAEKALAQHLLPPCVLMHERGDIVHIHGRTGLFLEPAPGNQRVNNIYSMARDGLSMDLALTIRQVTTEALEELVREGMKVKSNGQETVFDLRVRRLTAPHALQGLLLVAFEHARPFVVDGKEDDTTSDSTARTHSILQTKHLETELQHVKEMHQSTTEELETANEELKSSNEELQSTNEELQSANEELETSKEEMQSLNEELNAVNAELQAKVDDLSRINDDMKNLLNSTDIATLFLDRDLNIKRYTDQTTSVIRVISSDIGRSIGDLVSRLQYPNLVEDAREVLATLAVKEREVQSTDNRWYLTRILPYRTADNTIDGLVITFVDVTAARAMQAQSHKVISALSRAATVIFGQDMNLRYEWVSGDLLRATPEQAVGRDDKDLFPSVGERLHELKRAVLASGEATRKTIDVDFSEAKERFQIYLEPAREGGSICGLVGVLTRMEAEA